LQVKVHLLASPDGERILSLSLVHWDCIELQVDTGSQVSPLSTTPLPHLAGQSLSLLWLQLEGQQPSPDTQLVSWWSFTQAAVQVFAFTSLRI
jgi:hypothetical protein